MMGVKEIIGNVHVFYTEQEALLNYTKQVRPRLTRKIRKEHYLSMEQTGEDLYSIYDLFYCNGLISSMIRGCLCGLTLQEAKKHFNSAYNETY